MKFTAASILLSASLLSLASGRPMRNEGEEKRGGLSWRNNNGNRAFGKQPVNQGHFGQGQRGQQGKTTTSAVAKATTTAAVAAKATTTAVAAKGGKGVTAATTTSAAAVVSTAAFADSSSTSTAATASETVASTGSSTNTTAISTDAGTTADTATGSASTTAATEDNRNLQDSLTLDKALIGPNLAQDGQAVQEAGQVASLTSINNYINFCVGQTVTNGLQNIAGSCNPVPMGQLPAKTNMPSAKFKYPTNGGTVPANQNFTVQLGIQGMQTGAFVNANTNYFSAPQQLNKQGQIIGHSHITIESIPTLDSTALTDPTKFVFFKGLDEAAVNGILSATVAGGLPAGVYKMTTINTSANHVAVAVPVAQHGATEDCIYFTSK